MKFSVIEHALITVFHVLRVGLSAVLQVLPVFMHLISCGSFLMACSGHGSPGFVYDFRVSGDDCHVQLLVVSVVELCLVVLLSLKRLTFIHISSMLMQIQVRLIFFECAMLMKVKLWSPSASVQLRSICG